MTKEIITPARAKEIRLKLGMTFGQLAKKLNLSSPDAVRFWENGKNTITGPVSAALELMEEREGLLDKIDEVEMEVINMRGKVGVLRAQLEGVYL